MLLARHQTPGWLKSLKPFLFCSIFGLMALPVLSWQGMEKYSMDFYVLFLTPAFVFVLTPILDLLLGRDEDNPTDYESRTLSMTPYYKLLPILCTPAYAILLCWSAWIVANSHLSFLAQCAWTFSIGTLGGMVAINVAHELIHKNTGFERFCGGFLLSMVCYPGFKIEHIRHHHVMVSTPEDPSSSRLNESLYAFYFRAIPQNFKNAWNHEALRLVKKKIHPLSPLYNELIHWYLLTASIAVVLTLFFGLQGLLFFVGQSVFAILLLECVNYLEHYGLQRRKLENGKYEKVTPRHSWNSTVFWSSLYLFQLPRHSDHHAYASRRYQVLRHHDHAPLHPFGYPTMILIAFIPPLWFRIMNPLVEKWRIDKLS